MQFSLSLRSINGSTEGDVQWSDIDIESSSLSFSGVEVPLTESSGTANFIFDDLVVVDFETGNETAALVDLSSVEAPKIPPETLSVAENYLDPFV